MFDHKVFADELAKSGRKNEAVIYAASTLVYELSSLRHLCERANPDEPHPLKFVRLDVDQHAETIAEQILAVLSSRKHAIELFDADTRNKFWLANPTVAILAGQSDGCYVDAIISMSNKVAEKVAFAIDHKREWRDVDVNKKHVEAKALPIVRLVLLELPKLDTRLAELELAKEYQRLTKKLPQFEDAPPRPPTITAREAIKQAVNDLWEKGHEWPGQAEIAAASGFGGETGQTIKNNTSAMVMAGELIKGPGGRGFKVP